MAKLKNISVQDTGFIRLPVGTTAERPGNPQKGMLRFNSDLEVEEFFDGDLWREVSTKLEAEGGTDEYYHTQDGITYKIHVFGSSGTFVVKESLKADVLVVGGGGSGSATPGRNKGGGGGAGGVVFVPDLRLENKVYNIIVGRGGPLVGRNLGQSFSPVGGIRGEDSFFSDIIIALGGGAGEVNGTLPDSEKDGGSGGGGHYSSGGKGLQPFLEGLSGFPYGFGNDGGSGSSNGVGGGGAGSPGFPQSGTTDGTSQFNRWAGGIGVKEVEINGVLYNFSEIFGFRKSFGHCLTPETAMKYFNFSLDKQEIYFGGGGGGGLNGEGDATYGAGGLGGGGRGAFVGSGYATETRWRFNTSGESAGRRTGGGGGGSREGSSGAGGSGIIVVRYPIKRGKNG